VNLYSECRICSQQIDILVPNALCPFCGTPAGEKLGEVLRHGAGIGAVAVCQAVVPAFSNELPTDGALDLYIRAPHEHIHSTSSTERIGELTRPITNVTSMGAVAIAPVTDLFRTTKPSA